MRDEAEQYRIQVSAAETDRLRAQAQADAYARQLHDDGKKDTKAEQHDLRVLQHQGKTARAVPVPAAPANEKNLLDLYRRISGVIGISAKTIHERVIRGIADAPYSNITIRTDVPPEQFNYMQERPEYFKGIVVARKFLREYPEKDLAAQLFGTVSEIHENQVGTTHFKGATAGTRVGQSGLEYQYDKYLRGDDGYSKVVVNASGSRDDERRVSVKQPVQGERLKLTLDMDLEKVGDAALKQAMANSDYPARAGAYVAMDPTNGEILAMGSAPSFDANIFARPISESTYKYLTSNSTDAPLLNRATASGYPTGSTFKPVTAMAALENHLISPTRQIVDTGEWKYGGRTYQNAKHAQFGPINITDAIRVSSDIFFFQLGAWADDKDDPIQRMARQFGFGKTTGIDLPGESARAGARRGVAQDGLREVPDVHREGARDAGHDARTDRLRRHRAPVGGRRQRQPRRRPGRPAGHAAPARGRLLGARQRRHDRHAAPRDGDRGRQRRHGAGDPQEGQAPHQAQRARSPGRARRSARGRRPRPMVRLRTSSRAGT